MSVLSELQIVVSQILFENDPMGTCCVENECDDEYDYIAAAVVEDVLNGVNVYDAVREQLIQSFSDAPSVEDVEIIAAEIKARALF